MSTSGASRVNVDSKVFLILNTFLGVTVDLILSTWIYYPKVQYVTFVNVEQHQRQYRELDIQLDELSRPIPLNFNISASDVGLGVVFHSATKKLC